MEDPTQGYRFYDGLHPRYVRVDLRLLLNIAGIIHSESVEEIHEDDSCEEDKAEEENVGQHPVVGGTVDGDVTELQFTHKHC